MRRPLPLALCVFALCASACEGLIGADFGRGPGADVALDRDAGRDARANGDCPACRDATVETAPGKVYADVQEALEAARRPGPILPTDATVSCTSAHLFWVEKSAALHSWKVASQTRTDYAFDGNRAALPGFASASFIAVTVPPSYATSEVHRTDTPSALVASVPVSAVVATDDGFLRLDQAIDGVDTGGTVVRRWSASTEVTETLTATLPTRRSQASFDAPALVIPGGVTTPLTLFVVDVARKKTSAVELEVGTSLVQSAHGSEGLLIAYERPSGGGRALRLYADDQDSTRVEVSDELAKHGSGLEGAPERVHGFSGGIAAAGRSVIYTSPYGIWSYDLVTQVLVPLHLAPDREPAGALDLLCVISDANVLAYRTAGDGQVWLAPLP